ncbi:hypothetical protein ACMGD3_07820 [Lysinibacillus sphaericus]
MDVQNKIKEKMGLLTSYKDLKFEYQNNKNDIFYSEEELIETYFG